MRPQTSETESVPAVALNAKGGEAGDGGADDSCDEGNWCNAMVDEGPGLE